MCHCNIYIERLSRSKILVCLHQHPSPNQVQKHRNKYLPCITFLDTKNRKLALLLYWPAPVDEVVSQPMGRVLVTVQIHSNGGLQVLNSSSYRLCSSILHSVMYTATARVHTLIHSGYDIYNCHGLRPEPGMIVRNSHEKEMLYRLRNNLGTT